MKCSKCEAMLMKIQATIKLMEWMLPLADYPQQAKDLLRELEDTLQEFSEPNGHEQLG